MFGGTIVGDIGTTSRCPCPRPPGRGSSPSRRTTACGGTIAPAALTLSVTSSSATRASPRDSDGRRGHWEESLIGLSVPDPDNPLHLGHIVRSHDACLVCTTHMIRSGQRTNFVPFWHRVICLPRRAQRLDGARPSRLRFRVEGGEKRGHGNLASDGLNLRTMPARVGSDWLANAGPSARSASTAKRGSRQPRVDVGDVAVAA